MGKFIVKEAPLKDAFIIEPTIFGDNRGYFMETYNKRDFEEAGLRWDFVQDNQSLSEKGVLRGLHFQYKHPQGKLVRVIRGEVFDVVVDLRKMSDTFGKWYGIILSETNKKMLFAPVGFAHGFLVLSDTAEFSYKCTNYYHPEDEGGILWNDFDIGIEWPMEGIPEVKLSIKDKNNKRLFDIKDELRF